MKKLLTVLSASAVSLVLCSCAGMRVTEVQTATGAANPEGIYIRPFAVTGAFEGRHGGSPGERPIRRSLAGRELAEALRVQLSKLAPAMVIEDDETAPRGWLVEGEIEYVHSGNRFARANLTPTGIGKSTTVIHVKITDVSGSRYADGHSKGRGGKTVYEFTVSGGSAGSGRLGSIYAPGLGMAWPFDSQNAAERIYLALSSDPFRTGQRLSPAGRY